LSVSYRIPKVSIEQMDGLMTLAIETCGEEPDVFATRLRQIMKLPPSASMVKQLLARTMTREQYERAWTYYETLLAQLTRKTTPEVSHGTPSPATPVSESAHPPIEEAPAEASSEMATLRSTGHQTSTSEGLYATREQIASLKRLAAQVGPEAAEDLQDMLDHSPKGLLMDVYQRIETHLQGRLNGQKTTAVA
jgi:hypothetical protein